MIFRKNSVQLDEPNINLTPLIDVVFVILIMFIVIAPLLQVDRIELADGKEVTKNASSIEKSALVIHVFSNDMIECNNRQVSLLELDHYLHDFTPKSIRPLLFQDRSATFGTYQSIKNLLEKRGFSELDVILKQ